MLSNTIASHWIKWSKFSLPQPLKPKPAHNLCLCLLSGVYKQLNIFGLFIESQCIVLLLCGTFLHSLSRIPSSIFPAQRLGSAIDDDLSFGKDGNYPIFPSILHFMLPTLAWPDSWQSHKIRFSPHNLLISRCAALPSLFLSRRKLPLIGAFAHSHVSHIHQPARRLVSRNRFHLADVLLFMSTLGVRRNVYDEIFLRNF